MNRKVSKALRKMAHAKISGSDLKSSEERIQLLKQYKQTWNNLPASERDINSFVASDLNPGRMNMLEKRRALKKAREERMKKLIEEQIARQKEAEAKAAEATEEKTEVELAEDLVEA